MRKEEFAALGISAELAAKAEAASLKELEGYVPKADLEAAQAEAAQLKKDTAARDRQLEELKKSGGDSGALKKQIEDLQKANKEEAGRHAAELKELRLTNAVRLAVAGKVHDEEIAAGLFDRARLVLSEDGKVSGLEEQLASLRKEKAFLFKDGDPGQGPAAGGKGGYKPKGGAAREEGWGAQYAGQRNEAEKSGQKGGLWGTD